MHQLAGNQTALGAWDRLARRADVGPKCCKEANDANSFLQECGQEMMLRTERGLAMGPDQALSLQLDPQGAKE